MCVCNTHCVCALIPTFGYTLHVLNASPLHFVCVCGCILDFDLFLLYKLLLFVFYFII